MTRLRVLAPLMVAALFAGALTTMGHRGLEPPTRQLDGEQVEVAAVWSGAEQKSFRAVLDAFEKRTGASVTYTSTGDDIAATLTPRIAGGGRARRRDPAPARACSPTSLARACCNRSRTSRATAVDENYAPIWRELGSVDGTLYGVWFKAANKSLVWYNARVLEDAGVRAAADLRRVHRPR